MRRAMPAGPRRQILLLRAYAALTYPFACVPLLWFWFTDHGVSQPEYATLISVYYVTTVAAEIPTGLIADRFGSRQALLLGPLLMVLAFLTMAAGTGFSAFCAGQALFGLSQSMLSGPPSALMFETLRAADRVGEFHREESIANGIRLLGTGIAFLAGGVVAAAWGIGASIVLTAGLCAAAAVIALFIRDVASAADSTRTSPATLIRDALADLREPSVRWVLAYYVVLFCLLRFPFHTYQPFLQEAGADDPLLIGTLFFALNLFAAPFSPMTPWLVRRFGARAMFWAMPAVIAISLLLMARQANALGIALFFLHQVPFGMHQSLVQDHTNQRIRGHSRTTVLSVMSFAGRVVFALLFPLVMALSLDQAYLTVGLLGLAATALVMSRGGRG